ncbi:beta-class carbonic anhydrase [Leekyejoonella antrihumi]|uniref:carbonic anhydrase n=1 Tax=Leekyejoonella antrihumi TaxID=1660198 RepID=A0A563E4I8_9MICO|nr:carbonic anhydrase [Leekyejoonella antrihumi]TWP37416.1 carbonic anhydrase [Leekyejoonella antrihumi]
MSTADGFDDLLDANRTYAGSFALNGIPGVAAAGVAIVTCMDSRIDPLAILGLSAGDAKVLRNPGGRVTPDALEGVVLAVNLLKATRVMIIPHTRCAMASSTEAEMRSRIAESSGQDVRWQPLSVVADQLEALADDVAVVRSHPLVPDNVSVGGFRYDVDTGLLTQHL